MRIAIFPLTITAPKDRYTDALNHKNTIKIIILLIAAPQTTEQSARTIAIYLATRTAPEVIIRTSSKK